MKGDCGGRDDGESWGDGARLRGHGDGKAVMLYARRTKWYSAGPKRAG